ncbi:MAG: ABC transporter ATP-binding protein [Vallitaleaceae bacterium]|nr:ABC transporter ATP-binding protein [Vallitaleaceae bacterium]
MGFIEFKNITKSYNTSEIVIDHLSLTVPEGEFVTILGPSGCGKTTLLKMVNKLTPYSSGSITVDHKDIQDWDTIKLRRSIGYVIQQIGLLPHLNIEKNINYILNITKSDKKLRRGKAEELLELVGLSNDYLTRYPRELSGGQKQRVGVARALAANPKIILMDEPFGAVDEIARTALQDEILSIHNKLKKTILFVTHDIQEAIKLGSTIVLMNEGKIEQVGTKEDLIFSPANDFVKEFFGIKGFQATLDKSILRDLYKRILTKEESIDTLYQKLKN